MSTFLLLMGGPGKWTAPVAGLEQAAKRPGRQRTNATAEIHPSVTCSRMLVTLSRCPRAVCRLRARPPVVHAPLGGNVLTP